MPAVHGSGESGTGKRIRPCVQGDNHTMKLIYIADPMCSWCYGFGRTMDALLLEPGPAGPLHLALLMGGLRPYTTEPLGPHKADEIAGHWRHVAQASGQPFVDEAHNPMRRDGFIYDTEPASRAVVTVRSHWPKAMWRMFKGVQQAFYAEGLDVTQAANLATVAERAGIARAEFAPAFASQAMRDATAQDFAQAQAWGIRGFPALLAEQADGLQWLCQGYASAEVLRERLTSLAAMPPPTPH